MLGVCVDCVTMAETLRQTEQFIRQGGPHHMVTLDSSMCVLAQRDEALRRIILSAELVVPDSAGVLWASRRLGMPLPERVSGADLVPEIARMASEKGWRMYLLGSKPGIAELAARNLQSRFAHCCIAGTHHGYFSADEEAAVLEQIRQAAPHILCVAMGIPRQEKWIQAHRDALNAPVMIGVGGTLDVLSGTVPRAPRWMQQRGLEWAYRLLRNPRKIGKVLTLPRFVALVLLAGRGTPPQ